MSIIYLKQNYMIVQLLLFYLNCAFILTLYRPAGPTSSLWTKFRFKLRRDPGNYFIRAPSV